jgi:hypothetical protein
LHVRERGERAQVGPALFAETVDSRLIPHRLFRDGTLAFSQTVRGLKLTVPAPLEADTTARLHRGLRALQGTASALPRTTVDRMRVLDGEILVKSRKNPQATVWLHGIDADAQLRAGPGREDARELHVAADGTVQRHGHFALRVTADEQDKGLFRVRQAVEGLPTAELFQHLKATGLQAPSGTLSVFTTLEGRGEWLTGRSRLELRDLRVQERDDGVTDRLKAWVAQQAFDITAEDQGTGQVLRQTVTFRDRLDRRGSLFEDVVAALERATSGGWDALLRRDQQQEERPPVQGRRAR